jgi:acyl-CoA hydrolase
MCSSPAAPTPAARPDTDNATRPRHGLALARADKTSSESSGHRHISGTGGQLQFVRAGYASRGGKSFICMSSTYERAGMRSSRIVLNLTPGNVVTAPRSDMMFVVTEYGLVNLKGKSIPERAKAMISLAHPDFREDLEREARTNGLIPRSFA